MSSGNFQTRRLESCNECRCVGDFVFSENRDCIYIVLPNKDGKTALDKDGLAYLDALPITESAGHPCWTWDKNLDSPSLTPSIDRKGHWHGHLIGGQLISC